LIDWGLPGLGLGLNWIWMLGNLLVLAGLGAMAMAVWEFVRAKTTFIPRRVPTAFLQSGIYRLSRNPIYLGDAMVLAGLILRWDAPIAVPLVPLFAMLITQRFILGEEAGLEAKYGSEFTDWRAKVRRWI
ncbi:MAG: isoprenylcysteine carboxylmethyltransferase family protein, partial [Rhodobacteraceae bacterium]|nr:isoprenylcysteine carboxylmethyltransferase family protein [Paracoccaceae bacterium]